MVPWRNQGAGSRRYLEGRICDPINFGVVKIPKHGACKVSKHELYFLKDNYEVFSTEVSAREKQGQNSSGPHQRVTGSLGISSVRRPF